MGYFSTACKRVKIVEPELSLQGGCVEIQIVGKQLTVIDATIAHGKGHSFHCHPNQEEVIFVIAGKVEQWVDHQKRILNVGDAAFIPAGMVHASFNVGDGDVKMLAIFGPSVGEGFETIEMSGEAPWKALRA